MFPIWPGESRTNFRIGLTPIRHGGGGQILPLNLQKFNFYTMQQAGIWYVGLFQPYQMKYEKKLGLPLSDMGGGANFAPQFTKNSTSKPCRKLKFGILAYVNPTKRYLRKKQVLHLLEMGGGFLLNLQKTSWATSVSKPISQVELSRFFLKSSPLD